MKSNWFRLWAIPRRYWNLFGEIGGSYCSSSLLIRWSVSLYFFFLVTVSPRLKWVIIVVLRTSSFFRAVMRVQILGWALVTEVFSALWNLFNIVICVWHTIFMACINTPINEWERLALLFIFVGHDLSLLQYNRFQSMKQALMEDNHRQSIPKSLPRHHQREGKQVQRNISFLDWNHHHDYKQPDIN